jgi:hypothetical protein
MRNLVWLESWLAALPQEQEQAPSSDSAEINELEALTTVDTESGTVYVVTKNGRVLGVCLKQRKVSPFAMPLPL